MPLSRVSRLASLALALIFAVSAVNLTAPGVFVGTVTESAPDSDDEDREIELAAPNNSARQAPNANRPVGYFAHVSRSTGTVTRTSPRATSADHIAFADPLGSRLRC